MIKKQTVIEHIKILNNGSFQIRFAKMIVEGSRIISHGWHRCAFDPGTDVDAMLAAINDHLVQMGEARCEETETPFSMLTPAFLKEKVLMIHTPELVARYKAEREKALDAMRPTPKPSLFQKIVSALTPSP